MDGIEFHKQRQKQVLAACKEMKSTYGDDWRFVMPILYPDEFTYLKTIKNLKNGKRKKPIRRDN